MKTLNKIYHRILWFLGFRSGEFITYHLRRQARRLGALWFLLVGTTQGFIVTLLHKLPEPWFYVTVFITCHLVIALVYHVGDYRVPPPD